MPPDIVREFETLASPANTPNRNRIKDALTSYREVRTRFPAAVISAAWNHRQRAARDAGRPPAYYPQLARWLEDPGPDGAAAMCEQEHKRETERLANDLRVALSIDDDYMSLRAAKLRLSELKRTGKASLDDIDELQSIDHMLYQIREQKIAKLTGAATSPKEGRP